MTRPSLRAISDRYGQFSTFGHKDYEQAKAVGWTNAEIKGWLDQDQGRLHPDNRPGGSAGLYNQIAAGAVNPAQAVHIDRGPGPNWHTPSPPPPTGGGGGGVYNPPPSPWANWSPADFKFPEPPPPPPKMTTMGIGDIGAGSTALGVKTATGIGSNLNIGSTGEVFKRKPKEKKKKVTENLLPTSGLTA